MAKKQIATFLGGNKGLSVVGGHCYAYSGVQGVTNIETDLLNFKTGKIYIIATFQPSIHEDTSDNMFFKIYINGIEVSATLIGSTTSGTPFEETEILLPPLTNLKITCDNDSTSTSRNVAASLVGRVYDA